MKRLLTILGVLMAIPAFSQVNGDFRSKQSGNWNTTGTWEVFNTGTLSWDPATGTPTATNSVWIQDGDSVYLTNNGFCKNLHLNLDAGGGDSCRLNTQSFVLEVSGKMRCYTGAKNTIPGSNPGTFTNGS